MTKYAYAFKFYHKGNILNYGTHFVLAKNIEVACTMIKETFPNLDISSFWKMSDEEIKDNYQFESLLREHYYAQEDLKL